MSMPVEKQRYTVSEYLALEEQALDKHEYWDGEILAMSGGTYRHSTVATNFLIALGQRLKGKPCRPNDSNLRVRTSIGRYVYPDVQVVCGKPDFDPEDPKQTTIINPRVVIEVRSESTESYDRGKKFDAYMKVESLAEYVLADPNRAFVQTYNRQSDGSWRLDTYAGLDATVLLRSLELDIPLTEIYADVDLTPES